LPQYHHEFLYHRDNVGVRSHFAEIEQRFHQNGRFCNESCRLKPSITERQKKKRNRQEITGKKPINRREKREEETANGRE